VGLPVATAADRRDNYGDPLPPAAIARLGTVRLRHGGAVGFVAYALNGTAIVSAGNDQVVRVWDSRSGSPIRSLFSLGNLPAVQAGGASTLPIALSPDGKSLLTGSGGELTLWALETGKPVRALESVPVFCTSLTFAPDGKTIAGVGVANSGIQLWDAVSGKALAALPTEQQNISGIAFSPDGGVLASAAWRDGVRLWNIGRAGEPRQLKDCPQEVAAICFSPDGKTLALAPGGPFSPSVSAGQANHAIELWNVASGRKSKFLEAPLSSIGQIIYSRDGKKLAAVSQLEGVRVWETASGKLLLSIRDRHLAATCACFSPDGGTLLCGTSDSVIRSWDINWGKEKESAGHLGPVRALAFAPTGDALATTAGDSSTRLWQLPGAVEIRQFDEDVPMSEKNATVGITGGLSGLAFSADGKELAGLGSAFRVWSAATGQEIRRYPLGELLILQTAFYGPAVALSANWTTLAASLGTVVDVRDASTGVLKCRIEEDKWLSQHLALSPDGRVLALASLEVQGNTDTPGAIELRDSATGKLWRKWLSGQGIVRALTYSPDGRMLASAGNEDIRLWNTATGKELRRMQVSDDGLVTSLAFSADSRMLAVGTNDRKVRVWETASGGERCRFQGHRGAIACLAFDPDCRIVASGSDDTTALLWDLTGALPPFGGMAEPPKLPSDDLWADLACSNAARAYRAIWALVAHPQRAVAFLRQRLQPVPVASAQRVADLIAALDSDSFDVRSHASDELRSLHELAEPALRQVAANSPSLEVKRRARELLDSLDSGTEPEQWRQGRAIEALERIGSDDARAVLESIAAGAPDARLTQQARESLQRTVYKKLKTSRAN
jgi:WD40 repeat protein